MTDNSELKPISPEASELFERQRESDAVVQHKCTKCGAWYETPKGNVEMVESFHCDNMIPSRVGKDGVKKCNNPMTYTVPALPAPKSTLIQPSNDAVLAVMDGDMRLDTGMKIQEAIQRAADWWERTGRKQMQRELQRQAKPVGGSDKGAGSAFASKDAQSANFLPSGIIHGQPWEALGKRERLMIVKTHHHFTVRNPDLIGADDEAEHKMQDRGLIQ